MKNKIYGFTLVELLVVISIIAMLAALLLPALRTAKEQSSKIACSGNLKQFAIANIAYAQDNNDWPPISYTNGQLWDYQLMPYINYPQSTAEANAKKEASIFHCPSGTVPNGYSPYRSRGYSYNIYLSRGAADCIPYRQRFSKLETPGTMLLIVDFGQGDSRKSESLTFMAVNNRLWVGDLGSQYIVYIAYRHLGKTNVLFADGHTATCAKGPYDSANDGWAPQGSKWRNGGITY